MGQVRTAGFEVGDVGERFFEAEVRGVRFDTDTVEHEHVEIAKSVHRSGRYDLEIGRVGEIVESIGDDGQFAVDDLDRRHLDPIADAEWRKRLDRVRDQLRQPAAEMRRFKDVFEYPTQVGPRDLISINAHRAMSEIQRPYIVEPENVIDVAMRQHHGIQPIDAGTQCLLAKIDRRIDEDLFIRVFDQHGNT